MHIEPGEEKFYVNPKMPTQEKPEQPVTPGRDFEQEM